MENLNFLKDTMNEFKGEINKFDLNKKNNNKEKSNNNSISEITIKRKNSNSFFTDDSYENLNIKYNNNDIITQDDIDEGFEKNIPIPINKNQSFFNISYKIDNKVNVKLSNLGIKEIVDDLDIYFNNENYNEDFIFFLENKLKTYKYIIENNEQIINIYTDKKYKKDLNLISYYHKNLKMKIFKLLFMNMKKEKFKKRIVYDRNIHLKKNGFKILKIYHSLNLFKKKLYKKFMYKIKIILFEKKKIISFQKIFINKLLRIKYKIKYYDSIIMYNTINKIFLKNIFDKLFNQKFKFNNKIFFIKKFIHTMQIIKINKKINKILKRKSNRFKRKIFFKSELNFIYRIKKSIINKIKYKIQREISKKMILLNPLFQSIFQIILNKYHLKIRRKKYYFYEFLLLSNHNKKINQYKYYIKKKEFERNNLINTNKQILSYLLKLQNEIKETSNNFNVLDYEIEELEKECELLGENNMNLNHELNIEKEKHIGIFNDNIKEIQKLTKTFQNI